MTNYMAGPGAMQRLRSPERLAKIAASREKRRARLRGLNEERKAAKQALKKQARPLLLYHQTAHL